MLHYNNGYTQQQAETALTAANLKWRFPVALLDNKNSFLRWLRTVRRDSSDIDIDNTRDIITQWSSQVIEPYDYRIDPYFHRFQPQAWLRMRTVALNGDGSPYLKYPQGVFLASKFVRRRLSSKRWLLDIGGDDQTKILMHGCPTIFTIGKLTKYTEAIKTLMIAAGFTADQLVVEPHAGENLNIKEYEVGTPWVVILADLVKPINFEWFFDELGVFIARKWVDANFRAPAWSFVPDGRSVVYTEYEEDEGEGLDTPNYVYGTVSRQTQDGPTIFSAFSKNTNEASKYSINRRGFVIPYKMQLTDAPDQPTFQEQVDRKLAEISYAAKTTTLRSGLVPFIGPMSTVGARTEDGAFEISEFESSAELGSWVSFNVSGLKIEDGALKGKSTNNDPQVYRMINQMGAGPLGMTYRFARLVMKVRGGGATTCELFFTVDGTANFSPVLVKRFTVIADGEFHEYTPDMWSADGGDLWKMGNVTAFRIDPAIHAGRRFEIASAKLLRSENRFLVEKTKYALSKGARVEHTIRLVTTSN